MKIPMWQVDAFASAVFAGNPAAVCLLDDWLADGVLQAVAAENNLSETAFLMSARGGEVRCQVAGDRVKLAGQAATFLEGTICA